MAQDKRPKGPGLKWRKRATGPEVPYWFADQKAIEDGYPVKSVNLSSYASSTLEMLRHVDRLQAEMNEWKSGQRTRLPRMFDGTFRSLLEIYQTDPKSSFNTKLKPSGVVLYTHYLKKLIEYLGARRIDLCDGRDVMKWFEEWRVPKDGSDRDQLSVGRLCIAILKAAVSFGVICRLSGCRDFQAILTEIKFKSRQPRTQAPTAEQVIAVRKAAHAAGAPLRALAYAIQFETALRQWDVIGQWLPLSYPKPSALIHRNKKWVGPTWAMIDENMAIRVTPTKTETTTGAQVALDLSACPMVMEEIANIPIEKRVGPLIVKELNGRPYDHEDFRIQWRRDAGAAGLPKAMWNRDLRAGAITEGAKAGARRDDNRKVAGHSSDAQTMTYERGTVSLEAHRRQMASRATFRDKNGT